MASIVSRTAGTAKESTRLHEIGHNQYFLGSLKAPSNVKAFGKQQVYKFIFRDLLSNGKVLRRAGFSYKTEA